VTFHVTRNGQSEVTSPKSPLGGYFWGIFSNHQTVSSTALLRPFLCDSSSFGVRLLCGFFGKSTPKISHMAQISFPKSLLRQFWKLFHETLQYGRARHFRGGYLKGEDRFHSQNLEYSRSRFPAYRCLSNPVSH
jgi:hypothetical protein